MIPDTTDHEGQDQWWLNVFDENGDHSEPVLEVECGTFSFCVSQAANFASKNKSMKTRIVIGRIM